MKRAALIAMVVLLCGWRVGNGSIIKLLDNSDVVLTTPFGNLIE